MIYKVMVVEDETPVRNWIISMVNSMPKLYRLCAQARDGEEAWRKFLETCPDLVLADIQMPKINGIELLEKIKGVSPETEVIILSNYDDFAYVRTSFMEGVAEYFLKSEFDKNKLLSVHEILAKRKNRKNIAHIHQTIKNQFVSKLLNNRDINEPDIQSLLREYEIDLAEHEIAGMEVYIPEYRSAEEVVSAMEEITWDHVISHMHIFLISHPLRLILLFNIHTVSTAERDRKYLECVRQVGERLKLPVGSTGIMSDLINIQKIVKQCDEAVRELWFEKRGASVIDGNKTAELYELESLCREAEMIICQRESKNLAEILESLLEEARSIREFYPMQTNALLEQLYCRFCEAVRGTGTPANSDVLHRKTVSLRDQGNLVNEAREEIEHVTYEEAAEKLIALENIYECSIRQVSDATRQVVKYIMEHYAQISSMAEIAECLNYNDDYLYRRFKQEMGMSFVNYLTRIRLEKAAEMMCCQNIEPAQAAERVGYASVSYFNKKFKELYGETPSAWKKNMRH